MTMADDALRKIFKKIQESKEQGMIYKRDAINAMIKCGDWYTEVGNEEAKRGVSQCISAIYEIPSAQLPTTNNTGKWLGKYCPYTCDQCGKTSDSRTPFCRYCGADMRE